MSPVMTPANINLATSHLCVTSPGAQLRLWPAANIFNQMVSGYRVVWTPHQYGLGLVWADSEAEYFTPALYLDYLVQL